MTAEAFGTRPLRRRGGIGRSLIVLDGVTAINALAGAWYAFGGSPGVPTEWLDGKPFDDYVLPGLILGSVVAGTQAAAGIALVRRWPRAKVLSRVASGVLVAWIVTQLAMIGYVSPLQPIVLTWALTTLGLTELLEP